MPVIYPNSAGAARGARLLEFNPCHEPAGSPQGGQFAPKGQGDCEGMGSPVGDLDGREARRMTEALLSGLGIAPTAHPLEMSVTVRGRVKYGISHTLGAALDQHPQLADFVKAQAPDLEPHYRQTMTQEEVLALYREHVEDRAHNLMQARYSAEYTEYFRSRNRFIRAQDVKAGAAQQFEQQHGTLREWLTQQVPAYAAGVEAERQRLLSDTDELQLFARTRTQVPYDQLVATSPVSHGARAVASLLVKRWAETSADDDPLALALQQATVREFQLEGTFDRGETTATSIRTMSEEYGQRFGGLLQTFARAQYAQTQAWLASQKITHVTLFRGMKLPSDAAKQFARGGRADVKLQPVSSFTSDWRTAHAFSKGLGPGDTLREDGVVMAVRVPIARIFSTARTGVGCLVESEVTLLGGTYRAWVTYNQTVKTDRDFFMAWARAVRPELVDEE